MANINMCDIYDEPRADEAKRIRDKVIYLENILSLCGLVEVTASGIPENDSM